MSVRHAHVAQLDSVVVKCVQWFNVHAAVLLKGQLMAVLVQTAAAALFQAVDRTPVPIQLPCKLQVTASRVLDFAV